MNAETREAGLVRSLQNVGICYKQRTGMFSFAPFWALKDVSFDLYAGEVLGIIGRNGAGKTTLMQLLAETIEPDRGRLISDGSIATLLTLQLGFVPNLSGRDNAILSGLLMGLKRSEIEQKLPEILEFSELDHFLDQPVKKYSSGMRARLGFSVAFQLNSDVLLVDEVFGVGDAEFRKKSSAAMKHRLTTDRTVVLVSHNLSTIHDLCSRVVWIEDGVSRAEGSADEIMHEYKDFLRLQQKKKTTSVPDAMRV